MNYLLYILFLSVFILDYLSNNVHLISRFVSWLPEVLSMSALLIIPARFMIFGGKDIPPKCAFFLILLVANILIGAVVNLESAAPMIAGLRAYLKPLPFFILPFVYHFSNEQIGSQLKFVLSLFLIEAPISLYQRLVQSKGLLTGDYVVGTFSDSGQMTVALCCAIAVLMTFYLAKRINFKTFTILFVCIFIPMTVNETKVALILLPVALIMPILSMSGKISIKQYITMFILGTLAGIAFFAIYDYFIRPRWGYGLLDFLSSEGQAENYLYKGASTKGVPAEVGKLDTYVLAFKSISENILTLLFGFGIGNVSESYLSSLSGEYADKFGKFNPKGTGLALISWELGLFGLILYYAFYFMAYKDAKRLSQCGGLIGTLACGWSVVAVIMMLSTAYNNVVQENATGYLFWYFSGYIISECYKYKRMNMRTY